VASRGWKRDRHREITFSPTQIPVGHNDFSAYEFSTQTSSLMTQGHDSSAFMFPLPYFTILDVNLNSNLLSCGTQFRG